ncbi:MAG TPA: sodium:solute symporter [Flavobacteriales bacterium]|nr:sodium:solute symporter [Flavobacteriales bacterium]HRP82898.1 sodium:solute symporter [Flavobacteriales bacterium]
MHILDWTILLGTLGFIVGYGVWKTRHTRTSEGYLRGGSDARWWGVGLSVMATQASAITFLSTPGQGFADGLGFVQFYFGLPLAMVVINLVFIPLYYKWKVFTAYEFIGKRFDKRARLLTAGLFLVQRSMAAGITIYAPSIILSKVLDWPLSWTCLFIGLLVIIYTTTGGARAVGVTHKQQMAVMFIGMFVAFGLVVHYISPVMNFTESLQLAGALGKLKAVNTSFDPADKYTLWSGLIGGFFLQLSYFGTDQSQVQRYLGGQTMQQAKMGLWMNAVLKIPMQFFILLTGVLVFVFYLVNPSPVHWNATNVEAMEQGAQAADLKALHVRHAANNAGLRASTLDWVAAERAGDEAAQAQAKKDLEGALAQDKALRAGATALLKAHDPEREANDKDYIFITFIMDHLPVGVIGLLLAMIFSAGMSSTSAELSALATTSVVDVLPPHASDTRQVRRSQWATLFFGLLALGFAAIFSLFENLIQAVNILGSLFYGTILGIFLVAFFLKRVQGTAVFTAALIAQALILVLHFSHLQVAFLWYNLIAPAVTVVLALVLQPLLPAPRHQEPTP